MKSVLEEDLAIISESDIDFSKLDKTTVLITGATGFIGSLLVKSLLYASSAHKLNIRILAVVRSLKKAEAAFSDFKGDGRLEFIVCDLAGDELRADGKVDYIVHAASVTTSRLMVTDPVGVIRTSVNGTENVLRLAAEKKVRSFVYLSSMEAYGSVDGCADESRLGFVDLTSVRSCYPESKRMCECLCAAYSAQYGVRTKIARLAQTFGAGISPAENRVFAQFSRSVIENKNIVLHTRGESEVNFVYSRDAVAAILILLLSEETGTFNVANESCHTTVCKMAQLVCDEVAAGKISVVYDIPERDVYGYAPPVKLYLSAKKMRSLGWKPQVDMAEAYRRLVLYLAENGGN